MCSFKRYSEINSRSKALSISKIAQDKKAHDLVVLDMRKISNIADFFIICSGNSARQVKAIADHIIEKLKKSGQKHWRMEGHHHALWVLLDYGDVVVHVFHTPVRQFYNLERLWSDVPLLTLQDNDKEHAR